MTIKVFLEATPLVVDLEFPEGIEQGGCLTIILTAPGQKLVGEEKSGVQFSHVNNEIVPIIRTVTVEDDLAACIQTLQKVKIESPPLASGKLPCIVRLAPRVYAEREVTAEQDLSFPPIGKVLDCLPSSPTMFPAGSPDVSGASSAEEDDDDDDLDFQVPDAFGGPSRQQDLPDLPVLLEDSGDNADSPTAEPPISANVRTCTVCDYVTESADDLRYHIRLHAVQGELCCKLCQQQFHTLAEFKEHCDSHAPKPPPPPPRPTPLQARRPALLSCGACGKLFRSQAWLERHIQQRHGGVEDAAEPESADIESADTVGRGPPTLQCCACARTFSSASALQVHERLHFEGQPQSGEHACTQCDRSFTSYRGLRMHQRKHARQAGQAGQQGPAMAKAKSSIEMATAAAPFVTTMVPATAADAATIFSDAPMATLQDAASEEGDSITGMPAVVATAAETGTTADEASHERKRWVCPRPTILKNTHDVGPNTTDAKEQQVPISSVLLDLVQRKVLARSHQ